MMLNLTDVLLDDQRIETEVPIESDRLEFSFGSFPIIRKTPVLLVIQKKDPSHLVIEGKAEIETEPLAEIDYLKAVDGLTMQQVKELKAPALIAMAVRFGKARLLDNFFIE